MRLIMDISYQLLSAISLLHAASLGSLRLVAPARSEQPPAGSPRQTASSRSQLAASVPPAMDEPSVGTCVVVKPDHASVVHDAAKVFAGVRFSPSLAGNTVGSCRRKDLVPRTAVAIGRGEHMISSVFGVRLDRARRWEQIQRQSGIGRAGNSEQGTGRCSWVLGARAGRWLSLAAGCRPLAVGRWPLSSGPLPPCSFLLPLHPLRSALHQ